jgi:cytidine deaminase
MAIAVPDRVLRALAERGGVLPAAAVAEWAREGCAPEAQMVALLPQAARHAAAALSDFAVGAVLRGGADPAAGGHAALYLGANLEFAGQAPNFAVHAEQAAVNLAASHGETVATAIATGAAPCGHCRQFLCELPDAGRLRMLVASAPPRTLAELLPHSFGPADLGHVATLLRSPIVRLRLRDDSTDALVRDALHAAERAYAPYTCCPAGVALETRAGAVFTGRSLESAAFNPSLSAFGSAASAAAMARAAGAPLPALRRAVLVESAGRSSQRAGAEAMLAALAPDLALEYHLAEAAG